MNEPPALAFRRAGHADAARLSEFAARTFAETFGPDNRPEDIAAHIASAYGVAQQARELADADVVTLVVDAGETLAGYAQVRRSVPPPCVTGTAPVELYRFYVDRPWQGAGLARRLMKEVFRVARELGGRILWLSVWERNPRAIAFYAKCGLHDAGTTVFYVGPDRQTDRVLVMELPA